MPSCSNMLAQNGKCILKFSARCLYIKYEHRAYGNKLGGISIFSHSLKNRFWKLWLEGELRTAYLVLGSNVKKDEG